MKKSIFNRVGVGFIALGLVLAQVVMPVQAAFADAPGNNGTVKINDEAASDDPGNGNEPQLSSCTVFVRWYGFDAGLRDSTVTFEAQSPTENQLVSPTGPQDADFTAPTPVTGDTLSHEASYTLAFSGTPAAQGYKVKATVDTDGSQGNHTKSKVFWVPSSCATPERLSDPTISLTEVCGLNNDLVTPGTSDDYTAGEPVWGEAGVSVTFTIKADVNKVFSANGNKVITITVPEVNSEECPREPQPCTVSNNVYVAPWMYDEETYPFAGAWPEEGVPATATFVADGLYLTTPEIESYTYGLIDAGNTYLTDIDAMSYKTKRASTSTGYAQTLPAYILYVDVDGNPLTDNSTYFFYEPYYNSTVIEDDWQTWNLTGSAKWYVSGTGQALKTWDQLVAMYPDAKAIAYGYNQGTYNQGAITTIALMEFDCAVTAFTAGRGTNPPVIPDTPVTPVVPVVPATPVLPAELPHTGPAQDGSAKGLLLAIGAAIATYGAVYFAQPKRRYE